jgi:hypothetical protein
MTEKMKVTIGFRNGSQIEFYCDEITVNRNNLSGELVGYKIKGLDERTNPMYIKLSEIIYVLTSQDCGARMDGDTECQ